MAKFSPDEYRHESNAVSLLNYHFVFIPKRRKKDPSSIMRKIKGRASHHLRKEFPELLKILTLWTPSYFVSTAGNICTEPVKKYIEQQRD